jgi:hypothetical protein
MDKNHDPFKLNGGQSRAAFGLLQAPELQRLSVTVGEVISVGVMTVSRNINTHTRDLEDEDS